MIIALMACQLWVADTTFGPRAQGELRGTLWVQPPGVVSKVAYATPVRHGQVVPLDEHFTLYMRVTQDSGVTFRVPERNYLGGAAYARYFWRDGKFVDTTHTFDSFAGRRDGDRYIVTWPGLDVPLVLRPASGALAENYYPRPRGSRYTYKRPERDGDGWPVAKAADVGIDEAALAAVVQRIAETDPVPKTAPLIQAIAIARHGRPVLDEYFFGFDANRLHDLRSASKTFTSVMAGAAGVDMNTPLYAALGDPQPDRSRITVGHALTHSTGLACDDNDDNSPGNEDKMYAQTAQPDWYRFILDLSVAHDPGTVYAYCS